MQRRKIHAFRYFVIRVVHHLGLLDGNTMEAIQQALRTKLARKEIVDGSGGLLFGRVWRATRHSRVHRDGLWALWMSNSAQGPDNLQRRLPCVPRRS